MTLSTPISPPITLSTTMAQNSPGQGGYSRVDNPTRLLLERELAKLEKGRHALAFSSGSSAASTLLCLLKSNDHIICSQDIYEGTLRLLTHVFNKFNLEVSLVDFSNLDAVKSSIKPNTKLIWFENITNPTLKQINVKPISDLVKNKGILTLVDNTFATPVFCNPLSQGADIVLHSLTKFIGGHHDVTAGALIVNDVKLFNKLKFLQHTIGATPSPFDCFQLLQHLKTLSIRMNQHCKNAKRVSTFLESESNISRVSFPGISGIVSFWIKTRPKQFINKLTHIKIAHSLGGTESTILQPTSMMTWSLSKSRLTKMGISNNLFRLSVGLENNQLIINDLKRALKK
jgi:cystathionine gamma-lyase